METASGISGRRGFCHRLVGWWFRLTWRRIRLLHAGEISAEGPTLFAVSQPASFLAAIVLATALDRPVRCLLPRGCVRGRLAQFLARQMGFILHEGESLASEASWREAIDVLASGGALVVFADRSAAAQTASGAAAATASVLVWRTEAQHVGRRVEVRPVHLYLPESVAQSREILVYVDSALAHPEGVPAAPQRDDEAQTLAAAIESQFRENAFQLRPRDLECFLADLEEVLRLDLREDWASRPDWKQDAEGFVLSGVAAGWVKRTNYLNPGHVVRLRQTLDDYRHLQQQCALRRLEVEEAGSLPRSRWQRAIVWLETLIGLPIALYGLLNHLAIGLVCLLIGSSKKEHPRPRTTEWAIRCVVALAFYITQVFLVAHWWGRAAAGYYAPTLPVSGAYLWRYRWVLRRQARPVFISLTIPALTRKMKRLRQVPVKELDEQVTSDK